MSNKNILIINGPNLNLLGIRDTIHYGDISLDSIKNTCKNIAEKHNSNLVFIQSNYEGQIIEYIQSYTLEHKVTDIIINAAAYSHTSVAISDALMFAKQQGVYIVEVHLSNIYAREEFRKHSYISSVADAIICGFKDKSYILALQACCCR